LLLEACLTTTQKAHGKIETGGFVDLLQRSGNPSGHMEAPVNRLPVQHVSNAIASLGMGARSHADGCSVLEKFASLLGTKGPQQDIVSSSARMKELTSLLSPTTGDDDVVLTVPSLDLRLTEGERGKNDILPEVGAHFSACDQNSATASTSAGGESRPNMAASVLSLVSDDQTVIELKAAQNIGKRTSWTRSTVGYASGAVGVNISDSFTTLLNSRLRAWTLLLLRHSLSTGSGESRTRLLSMLAADLQVKSIETEFKTLPLPDAAKGAKPKDSDVILPMLFQVTLHTTIQNQPENVTLRAPGTISGQSLALVPLFSNCLEIARPHSILFLQFAAIFDSGVGLKIVNVQLDTRVVLKSMLDQARISVMKAVASATDTAVPAMSAISKQAAANSPAAMDLSSKQRGLSSESPKRQTRQTMCVSSSGIDDANRLKKARTSALRLNSVLHGRSLAGRSPGASISHMNLSRPLDTTSGAIPHVRSVRFDHPIRAPKLNSELKPTPDPEKIRMAQTANKLKSFKSFGRPHAGDFGTGPRNATFGEFGFAGAWGRDGRLAAHPMPGQATAFDAMMENSSNGTTGSSGGVDKNATFDNLLLSSSSGNSSSMLMSSQMGNGMLNPFLRVDEAGSRSTVASGSALFARTNSASSNKSNGSSMPRTATALESLFMKKWT
jgi:hypothetical protein